MSLGKIAMTKEVLWQWMKKQWTSLDTRVTVLENSGGGGPVNMTGDVTGDSSSTQVVAIGGYPFGTPPIVYGDYPYFDGSANLLYGQPSLAKVVEYLNIDSTIGSTTDIAIIDTTLITSDVLITLPSLTYNKYLVVQIIGSNFNSSQVNLVKGDSTGIYIGTYDATMSASFYSNQNIVLYYDTNTAFWNILSVSRNLTTPLEIVNANYNATTGDNYIVNTTNGSIITLPYPYKGITFTIKSEGALISTVRGYGGATFNIDGGNSITVLANTAAVLVGDGSNYIKIK